MSEVTTRLKENLKKQAELGREVIALETKKSMAIVERKMETLMDITASVEACSKQWADLEKERTTLGGESLPGDADFEALRRELVVVVQNVISKTETNQTLLRQNMHMVEDLLKSLSAASSDPQVYGESKRGGGATGGSSVLFNMTS